MTSVLRTDFYLGALTNFASHQARHLATCETLAHYPQMVLNILIGLTFLGSASLGRAPLLCPVGMEHQARLNTAKPWFADYCLNFAGRKEGPFRLVSGSIKSRVSEGSYVNGERDGEWFLYEDERLQTVTTYRRGEEISSKMTIEALRALVDVLNEKYTRERKARTIEVIDEHTLTYRYVKGWPFSVLTDDDVTDRIHEKLVSNPEICEIFSMPMTQFENIRAVFVDSDGHEFGTLLVTKSECLKQ